MDKRKLCKQPIVLWLSLCCIMVVLTVGIGGFTRLTRAGLSITEWKPITGILPPLSTQAWMEEKLKYEATSEYQMLNYGVSMPEFQMIYLIEYIHRLVARLTGLIFILPFIYFISKKQLHKSAIIRMFLVLLLGTLQAFVGWYMVKSGLGDTPHISHYRLALHLLLALAIFALLLYQIIKYQIKPQQLQIHNSNIHYVLTITVLIVIQMVFGAFTAGLHAGYIYNTFPLMDGKFIPSNLLLLHPIWLNFFYNRTMIQFIHRLLALLILTLITVLTIRVNIKPVFCMLFISIIQITLGIAAILFQVPVTIAVLHQISSFILFGSSMYSMFIINGRVNNDNLLNR